jgi:hypothetical protein
MADRDRPIEPGEGFMQRWSRRKAEARETAAAPAPSSGDPAERAPASAPVQGAAPSGAALRPPVGSEPKSEPARGDPAPVAPEDLPDIESLDAGSDFSVFMRPGVPAQLRTQALRKLWRADPTFSKIDGLLEYGEDYTIQSWPKGMIQTAYRIGRGFVTEIEKLAEADDQPAPSEEPAPGSPSETGSAVTSAGPQAPTAIPAEPPAAPSGSTTSDHTRGSARVAANPAGRPPRWLPRRG